jgi:hypothetical protein
MADAKPAVKKLLELCLVENPELVTAMIELKRDLERGTSEKAPPPRELRIAALKLAKAAQQGLDLAKVFGVEQGDQDKKLGAEEKIKVP